MREVDVVLAFGDAAREVIGEFARALNIPRSDVARAPASDEALFWSRSSGQALRVIKVDAPRQVHRRHTGKYAVGDVGEWQSFYFRGPGNAINVRAQNLMQFLQIAEQVEDALWERHLRANDCSTWFRHVIRDEELAHEAADITGAWTLAKVADALAQPYLGGTWHLLRVEPCYGASDRQCDEAIITTLFVVGLKAARRAPHNAIGRPIRGVSL